MYKCTPLRTEARDDRWGLFGREKVERRVVQSFDKLVL
jgi:hypothetical protein